jgi:hypothetical protein
MPLNVPIVWGSAFFRLSASNRAASEHALSLSLECGDTELSRNHGILSASLRKLHLRCGASSLISWPCDGDVRGLHCTFENTVDRMILTLKTGALAIDLADCLKQAGLLLASVRRIPVSSAQPRKPTVGVTTVGTRTTVEVHAEISTVTFCINADVPGETLRLRLPPFKISPTSIDSNAASYQVAADAVELWYIPAADAVPQRVGSIKGSVNAATTTEQISIELAMHHMYFVCPARCIYILANVFAKFWSLSVALRPSTTYMTSDHAARMLDYRANRSDVLSLSMQLHFQCKQIDIGLADFGTNNSLSLRLLGLTAGGGISGDAIHRMECTIVQANISFQSASGQHQSILWMDRGQRECLMVLRYSALEKSVSGYICKVVGNFGESESKFFQDWWVSTGLGSIDRAPNTEVPGSSLRVVDSHVASNFVQQSFKISVDADGASLAVQLPACPSLTLTFGWTDIHVRRQLEELAPVRGTVSALNAQLSQSASSSIVCNASLRSVVVEANLPTPSFASAKCSILVKHLMGSMHVSNIPNPIPSSLALNNDPPQKQELAAGIHASFLHRVVFDATVQAVSMSVVDGIHAGYLLEADSIVCHHERTSGIVQGHFLLQALRLADKSDDRQMFQANSRIGALRCDWDGLIEATAIKCSIHCVIGSCTSFTISRDVETFRRLGRQLQGFHQPYTSVPSVTLTTLPGHNVTTKNYDVDFSFEDSSFCHMLPSGAVAFVGLHGLSGRLERRTSGPRDADFISPFFGLFPVAALRMKTGITVSCGRDPARLHAGEQEIIRSSVSVSNIASMALLPVESTSETYAQIMHQALDMKLSSLEGVVSPDVVLMFQELQKSLDTPAASTGSFRTVANDHDPHTGMVAAAVKLQFAKLKRVDRLLQASSWSQSSYPTVLMDDTAQFAKASTHSKGGWWVSCAVTFPVPCHFRRVEFGVPLFLPRECFLRAVVDESNGFVTTVAHTGLPPTLECEVHQLLPDHESWELLGAVSIPIASADDMVRYCQQGMPPIAPNNWCTPMHSSGVIRIRWREPMLSLTCPQGAHREGDDAPAAIRHPPYNAITTTLLGLMTGFFSWSPYEGHGSTNAAISVPDWNMELAVDSARVSIQASASPRMPRADKLFGQQFVLGPCAGCPVALFYCRDLLLLHRVKLKSRAFTQSYTSFTCHHARISVVSESDKSIFPMLLLGKQKVDAIRSPTDVSVSSHVGKIDVVLSTDVAVTMNSAISKWNKATEQSKLCISQHAVDSTRSESPDALVVNLTGHPLLVREALGDDMVTFVESRSTGSFCFRSGFKGRCMEFCCATSATASDRQTLRWGRITVPRLRESASVCKDTFDWNFLQAHAESSSGSHILDFSAPVGVYIYPSITLVEGSWLSSLLPPELSECAKDVPVVVLLASCHVIKHASSTLSVSLVYSVPASLSPSKHDTSLLGSALGWFRSPTSGAASAVNVAAVWTEPVTEMGSTDEQISSILLPASSCAAFYGEERATHCTLKIQSNSCSRDIQLPRNLDTLHNTKSSTLGSWTTLTSDVICNELQCTVRLCDVFPANATSNSPGIRIASVCPSLTFSFGRQLLPAAFSGAEADVQPLITTLKTMLLGDAIVEHGESLTLRVVDGNLQEGYLTQSTSLFPLSAAHWTFCSPFHVENNTAFGLHVGGASGNQVFVDSLSSAALPVPISAIEHDTDSFHIRLRIHVGNPSSATEIMVIMPLSTADYVHVIYLEDVRPFFTWPILARLHKSFHLDGKQLPCQWLVSFDHLTQLELSAELSLVNLQHAAFESSGLPLRCQRGFRRWAISLFRDSGRVPSSKRVAFRIKHEDTDSVSPQLSFELAEPTYRFRRPSSSIDRVDERLPLLQQLYSLVQCPFGSQCRTFTTTTNAFFGSLLHVWSTAGEASGATLLHVAKDSFPPSAVHVSSEDAVAVGLLTSLHVPTSIKRALQRKFRPSSDPVAFEFVKDIEHCCRELETSKQAEAALVMSVSLWCANMKTTIGRRMMDEDDTDVTVHRTLDFHPWRTAAGTNEEKSSHKLIFPGHTEQGVDWSFVVDLGLADDDGCVNSMVPRYPACWPEAVALPTDALHAPVRLCCNRVFEDTAAWVFEPQLTADFLISGAAPSIYTRCANGVFHVHVGIDEQPMRPLPSFSWKFSFESIQAAFLVGYVRRVLQPVVIMAARDGSMVSPWWKLEGFSDIAAIQDGKHSLNVQLLQIDGECRAASAGLTELECCLRSMNIRLVSPEHQQFVALWPASVKCAVAVVLTLSNNGSGWKGLDRVAVRSYSAITITVDSRVVAFLNTAMAALKAHMPIEPERARPSANPLCSTAPEVLIDTFKVQGACVVLTWQADSDLLPIHVGANRLRFRLADIDVRHVMATKHRFFREMVAWVLADALVSFPAIIGSLDVFGNVSGIASDVVDALMQEFWGRLSRRSDASFLWKPAHLAFNFVEGTGAALAKVAGSVLHSSSDLAFALARNAEKIAAAQHASLRASDIPIFADVRFAAPQPISVYSSVFDAEQLRCLSVPPSLAWTPLHSFASASRPSSTEECHYVRAVEPRSASSFKDVVGRLTTQPAALVRATDLPSAATALVGTALTPLVAVLDAFGLAAQTAADAMRLSEPMAEVVTDARQGWMESASLRFREAVLVPVIYLQHPLSHSNQPVCLGACCWLVIREDCISLYDFEQQFEIFSVGVGQAMFRSPNLPCLMLQDAVYVEVEASCIARDTRSLENPFAAGRRTSAATDEVASTHGMYVPAGIMNALPGMPHQGNASPLRA